MSEPICVVHMLVHPNTRRDWLEQAREAMQGHAGVALVEVPAVIGHLGKARISGFRTSFEAYPNAPYCAWVDDDDPGPVPGAFDSALAPLIENPAVGATFSDLHRVDINGNHLATTRKPAWSPLWHCTHLVGFHHLHVLRRSALEPFIDQLKDWPAFEEQILGALIGKEHAIAKVDKPLYRWRVYDSPSRPLMNKELRAAAYRFTRRHLLL